MEDWKVDHISIAVNDLEKGKNFFSRILKEKFIKEVKLPQQNAKAAYYLLNDIIIGLETPLSDSGDIHKFLEKKGEGIHHIAFNTDHLSELRTELNKEGIKVIAEQEKIGVKREFFTHPKSSFGVLLQLTEWDVPYKGSLQKRVETLAED